MKKIISLIPAKQNLWTKTEKFKLNGLAFIWNFILASKKSKKISKTFISSDSDQIKKKSFEYDVNFIKEKKLQIKLL